MFSSNTSQVSNAATYIEDVFSTYLYTGVSSGQMNINTGIDLAGKGGAVWIKSRGSSSYDNYLFSTATGGANAANSYLRTNTTAALDSTALSASFTSTGFLLNANNGMSYDGAGYGTPYVSWTFRKQPKFFDVVTWTGNGTNQTVNHSLGSLPGCIIYKRTDSTSDWFVSTRNSAGDYEFLKLNTAAASVAAVNPASIDVTATSFDPFRLWGNVNGASYVAYLFAHNAGGFGLTGTDNVISCGSFTTDSGGNASVNLGYEPQWILIRQSDGPADWMIIDNMRGWTTPTGFKYLTANTSGAEASWASGKLPPNATGFSGSYPPLNGAANYIYIAIRRGPMKVPTDATKVFLPTTYASPGVNVQSTVTTNFPIDLNICGARGANGGYTYKFWFTDRLRVSSGTSTSNSLLTAGAGGTPAETTYNGLATFFFDRMTSYQITDSNGSFNGRSAGELTFGYDLRRAPSFFDEVCYTGTGAARTISHNLGVAPELIITKQRSAAGEGWGTGTQFGTTYQYLLLNSTAAATTRTAAGDNFYRTVSSTSYDIGIAATLNASGATYVAYLFASCPGVSKVGSFTGNGSSQTINCGFTAGARFVMIKRTDAAGEWYVWDSARGIVPGNDPYLSFSSQNSEDWAGASDSVDADTSGFIVNQNATNDVNVNGASYIFLAIA